MVKSRHDKVQASRRDQVRKAIEKIRSFHELGLGLPAKQRHRDIYSLKVIEGEAKRRGMNPETVRQARQFAEIYSEEEMEALCHQVMEKQADAEPHQPIFTRTHVVRLLSVGPKRRREALLRKAIEECWSCSRLENEISKRMGTRREGGRRPRIPNSLSDFYADLEKMCEAWRRWRAELERSPGEGRDKHVQLDDLPGRLRRPIIDVSEALAGLQQKVVMELKGLYPGWQERQAFLGE